MTILYSGVYQLQYRESSMNDVLQNKKRPVLLFLLHISHIVSCWNIKGERFVYWLIQRDDEHNNKTIDLMYSIVYLWVVLCYVETIKRQTYSFISPLPRFCLKDKTYCTQNVGGRDVEPWMTGIKNMKNWPPSSSKLHEEAPEQQDPTSPLAEVSASRITDKLSQKIWAQSLIQRSRHGPCCPRVPLVESWRGTQGPPYFTP